MTELTITPKVSDKTARFKGTVAAGEHVAVTIKGGAEWLGEDDGANLTLRLLDMVTGRSLAVFPRPAETLEDGETQDAWSVSSEDANDLYCELNLNTTQMVAAARHMLRVPVLFVLGDTDNPRTLYFKDRHEVEYWPERIGDTVPYDLDKWPRQIDEWTELVAGFGETLDGHVGDNERHITASERATWNGKVSPSALAAYVNAAAYDTVTKKILLKNGNSIVSEIDASDFVKDGMVSSVDVVGENLVITFNTDAGKSPISIPLSGFAVQQVQSDWNQQDSSKKDFIKNKPTIPAAQVNADWNATKGKAQILNKPDTFPPGSHRHGMSDVTGLVVALGGKANRSEMLVTPGTGADADKTTIQLKSGTSATVLTAHQDVSDKADANEVNAALALKADADALPYSLVVPGEWTFAPFPEGVTSVEFLGYSSGDGWGISVNSDAPVYTGLNEPNAVELEWDVYGDGTCIITATRTLPGHLADRAANAVVVSTDTTLTLPAANPGHARDLLVRLEISGSTVPTITFAAPTGETITYETDGDEFPVPDEAGAWLYAFTETAAHTFAVALKSVNSVTQGGV